MNEEVVQQLMATAERLANAAPAMPDRGDRETVLRTERFREFSPKPPTEFFHGQCGGALQCPLPSSRSLSCTKRIQWSQTVEKPGINR